MKTYQAILAKIHAYLTAVYLKADAEWKVFVAKFTNKV